MRSEVADVTGIVKYIRVFRHKTWEALPFPIFLFEGATDPPAPLLLRLCLSQNEVKYMNPFPEIKSLKYDFYTLF